jgi:hypothetical protein
MIARFLVILPALAQKLVDSANLPIHSAKLMKPGPDSITVSLVASLKVPLGLTVKLDATELHLYSPETKPFSPYVTVTLPAQKLKGNTTISLLNQTVKIQNMTEFTAFLKKAVYAEEFVLYAKAKSTAHLGKLNVKIHLNKGVKLKGKLPHLYLNTHLTHRHRPQRAQRLQHRCCTSFGSATGRRFEHRRDRESTQSFNRRV